MALWFVVQVGTRRVPVPLFLLLPLSALLDVVVLLLLVPFGAATRRWRLLRIGTGFYLSRLTALLMLHGRRFRISVCDGQERVRLYGGWWYR